jgi:hypothetical protein
LEHLPERESPKHHPPKDGCTVKPEQANHQGAAQEGAGSDEQELSAEITLDLVVKTAFELQKLRGPEGFQKAAGEGRTELYFYDLGTEAIRLLFGWAQLLRTEKKAGWALRKSALMASLAKAKITQEQQEAQEFTAHVTQTVEMRKGLEQKLKTAPVPFDKAAKDLLPARTKREDAVPDLKIYLSTLARMLPSEYPLVPIIQQCLEEKTIPKGLIPDLKPFLVDLHKDLVGLKRKASGTMGGRHRAASRLAQERSSQRAKRKREA